MIKLFKCLDGHTHTLTNETLDFGKIYIGWHVKKANFMVYILGYDVLWYNERFEVLTLKEAIKWIWHCMIKRS